LKDSIIQIQPTNHIQSNKTNFGALKSIKCVSVNCQKRPCTYHEKNIIEELKDLAKVDKFFKENDVNAKVQVSRLLGAIVRLEAKPTPKNFVNKIKNFFTTPKVRIISDNHHCPLDSTFFVAKKLREMKNLAIKQNS